MSKHSVRGGNVAGLLERFAQLQEKVGSNGSHFDHRHSGSGVGRLLDSSCAAEEGIESHVVDPASVANITSTPARED